jgi:hypothetical protein
MSFLAYFDIKTGRLYAARFDEPIFGRSAGSAQAVLPAPARAAALLMA